MDLAGFPLRPRHQAWLPGRMTVNAYNITYSMQYGGQLLLVLQHILHDCLVVVLLERVEEVLQPVAFKHGGEILQSKSDAVVSDAFL